MFYIRLARSISAMFFAFVASSSSAWGQTYTLEWFNSANAFVSSGSTINVTAGTPLTLSVYIHETGGTTLQTDTLASFGLRTTYGTPGVLSVASLGSPDMVINPSFDIPSNRANPATHAQFAAATTTIPGIASDGNGRILLGTLRYQTALGSTTLTAQDIPITEDWILGTSITVIDSQIVTSQINVNVLPVPEPATILGISAAVLIGFVVRRRRPASF